MISFHVRPPLWAVPLAIAGLVAVLGWWGNQRLRQTIEEELEADLAATLDANATALEIWTADQAKLARSLAEEPTLRAMALQVLSADTDPDESSDRNAPKELGDYLKARLDGLGYEIAHLVNTNFLVVANSSRGRSRVGVRISEAHLAKFSELFSSGRPVIITPFKPRHRVVRRPAADGLGRLAQRGTNTLTITDDPLRPEPGQLINADGTLMQVAAPIRDNQSLVRGALALVINPDQEFTRILSVARSGKSGETYVFDQNGLMLSRSRFEDQLKILGLIENRPGVSSAASLRLTDPGRVLKEGRLPAGRGNLPLMRLVGDAIAGGAGVDVQPSRDYRGIPVVGAWRWLPRHGFGIVTQLDAEEAFKPLRVLNLLFLILFLLLMLTATGLFLFTYLGVIWKRRLGEAELKLRQLGQYRLEEQIGEGAMGVVYRAQHALMRRATAVKLLLPDRADAASILRFEREVRVTCQLTHPNTIQVYDYGHTPEGIFYYAMELLEGLNVHELVKRYGAQPEARVVYILGQICDALAEAHALGLVHRDIKPANIFICDRGGVPDWVKVLDFGLVRPYRGGRGIVPVGDTDTRAEGTPLFMAPEAFKDSAGSDPRSDIYALGALGYFLVTGQYVFEGKSDYELYEKHLRVAPQAPSQRVAAPISAELEETLLRALEKEPNLRPQSVKEMHELLLTSPLASAWGMEARRGWWMRTRVQDGLEPGAVLLPLGPTDATVKIQMPDNVKASHAPSTGA